MALSEPEGGLDWQDHGTRGVLLGDVACVIRWRM